ncbi:MAG: hypothetical protein U1E86_13690 [Burkholderiaceae bacterium]
MNVQDSSVPALDAGDAHAPAQVPDPASPPLARVGAAEPRRHRPGEARIAAHASRDPLLPMLLIGGALVFWLAFQTWQLVAERGQLDQAFASQTRTMENATQFRARLDKIARETQILADKGNPNAKLLVEELRKRGVTINPNAPAAGSASAGAAAPAAR